MWLYKCTHKLPQIWDGWFCIKHTVNLSKEVFLASVMEAIVGVSVTY